MKYSFAANIVEPGSSVRNKTGGWRTMKPVREQGKCTKCGICWQFCPDSAINEEFEVNYDYCKGCGICAQECPLKAITMVKEEK
jgi:2-oxoacid:acceptor oxidoreductase delta subunit (pyruvate/2-ketoisovalerate family)